MHFNYKKINFTQGNSYNVCILTVFIRAINARQNSVKRRSRIGKTDGIGELARAYRDCYDDSRQQEGRMRVAAALPRIAWGSCMNPSQLMSDTTAQEAKIPSPTETGLMMRFLSTSSKSGFRLGWKISRYQRQCERKSTGDQRTCAQFPLICEGQGAKRKSWTQNLSHSERVARKPCRNSSNWIKVDEQGRKRLNSSCRLDGQTSSTNYFLSQNRFRRPQENYSSADVGVVFDRKRQGRKKGRVWAHMGNQSTRRRIFAGISPSSGRHCSQQRQ